jgi:hypothetical protein
VKIFVDLLLEFLTAARAAGGTAHGMSLAVFKLGVVISKKPRGRRGIISVSIT